MDLKNKVYKEVLANIFSYFPNIIYLYKPFLDEYDEECTIQWTDGNNHSNNRSSDSENKSSKNSDENAKDSKSENKK